MCCAEQRKKKFKRRRIDFNALISLVTSGISEEPRRRKLLDLWYKLDGIQSAQSSNKTHSAIYILRTRTHGQKKTTTTTSLNSPQFTFMDVDYLSNVYFERGERQPKKTTKKK